MQIRKTRSEIFILLIFFTTFLFQSCASFRPSDSSEEIYSLNNIIPKPLYAEETRGYFLLKNEMNLQADNDLKDDALYLAERINECTGFNINLTQYEGDIILRLDNDDISLGEEGYVLKITGNKIELSAYKPAGIFYGIQTIRQLLPPVNTNIIEEKISPDNLVYKIPAGVVRDHPRFKWRGSMLDVARHFFSVEDVKRYIDVLSYYKFNRFHIHLSDDQGWRIEIKSWQKLTEIGGSSSVNNEKSGYFSQADYTEIVKYAAERYITVVPEIDMPGHTHAALLSYPELNCIDTLLKPYTGIEVGFSSLCIKKEITYKFISDVISELSELTPGEFIHVGGDEALATDSAEYVYFINKVQDIVNSNNKRMVGWEEISQSALKKNSIVQLWRGAFGREAVKRGVKIIMSPASRLYLDMKYDSTASLGLNWAGYVEVKDAYDWNPEDYVEGLTEFDLIGIEAPLWAETITKFEHIEHLIFPKIIGVAEIGWSQKSARNWDEYKLRLANHGTRLKAMGINFYKSPQVPWKTD